MVPRTEFQLPTAVAPEPSWAAQPSVIPATTGIPGTSPHSAAAPAQTSPITVPGITRPGRIPAGIPRVAKTCPGQATAAASAPDLRALLVSVGTSCPTSLRLITSFWWARRHPSLRAFGYRSSSQRSLGSPQERCIRR